MKIQLAFVPLVSALALAQAPSAAGSADTTTAGQTALSLPAPALKIIVVPQAPPKVEYAVINTPQADYLQSEFFGLGTETGVRLDSVSIHGLDSRWGDLRANLEVHLRWAEPGRDSAYPAARRMQFLTELELPDTIGTGVDKLRLALHVDTVWSCLQGRCVVSASPKVVRNFESRWLECGVACLARDSSEILTSLRERIGATGLAFGLRPSKDPGTRIDFDWSRTTGGEEFWSLCANLPGNLGNWVSREQVRFEVAPLAYTSAAKPYIPRSLDYPTGPAQYLYNRTAGPNLMIAEDQEERVVNDTLVKFGKTLMLGGNTRMMCGLAVNDSAAAKDSWFVLPDGADAASIDRALSPAFCGSRSNAWRMNGDTVWLGNTKWPVLLQDLLSASSIQGKLVVPATGSAPKLVGARLELPWSATVVARDLSGRRLGASSSLTAGSHELNLAGHRGAFMLDIRSQDGKQSRSLKGSAFAR